MKVLLSCGGYCQKQKPQCAHLCDQKCHPAQCATKCDQKINVKCSCGRIKQKWGCEEAQAARKKDKITDPENVSLLVCDEKCMELKKEKMQRHKKGDNIDNQAESAEMQPGTQDKANAPRHKRQRKDKATQEKQNSRNWLLYFLIAFALLFLATLVGIALKTMKLN
jgi:NF-X1-type zinc finger protein NFXL1